MANRGSKSVKLTAHNNLVWSWEISCRDITNKTTTVAWKAEITADESGAIESYESVAWSFRAYTIATNQTWTTNTGSGYLAVGNNETAEIASGSFNLPNNCSYRFELSEDVWKALGQLPSVRYVEGGLTLDPYPQGVVILGAPKFNDEQNPTLRYSIDSPQATDISATLQVGSYSITRRIASATGSYTFELSDTERNNIRKQVTDSIYGDAEFTINISLYGQALSDTITGRIEIVNAEPIVSPTYTINGDYTYILAEQNSIAVKANATSKKYATIKSYIITCGNKQIKAASGTFTDISSDTINFTVIDSRGIQSAASVTLDMIPYLKPTVVLESTNPVDNDNGTVTVRFNISGAFYNGSFRDGGSGNALTLNYRTKIDGTYSEWTWLDKSISGNSYATSLSYTLRPTQQITLEVEAQDNINTVTATLVSKQLQPIFDWSSTDFAFNVPVYIQGHEVPTIVASGSFTHTPNGTFYWRRWSDGTAECWGSTSFTTAIQTVWVGGMHTSGAISSSEINLSPVGFNATPNIVAQLRTRSTGAWLMVPGGTTAASKSSTGMYELVRPAAYSTQSQYTICYDIKGRWK